MEVIESEHNRDFVHYFINAWVDEEIEQDMIDFNRLRVRNILTEELPSYASDAILNGPQFGTFPEPTVLDIYDIPPNDEEPCD